MDDKVLDSDEQAELPYIDDSQRFVRLMKLIDQGTLVEALEIRDEKGDAKG